MDQQLLINLEDLHLPIKSRRQIRTHAYYNYCDFNCYWIEWVFNLIMTFTLLINYFVVVIMGKPIDTVLGNTTLMNFAIIQITIRLLISHKRKQLKYKSEIFNITTRLIDEQRDDCSHNCNHKLYIMSKIERFTSFCYIIIQLYYINQEKKLFGQIIETLFLIKVSFPFLVNIVILILVKYSKYAYLTVDDQEIINNLITLNCDYDLTKLFNLPLKSYFTINLELKTDITCKICNKNYLQNDSITELNCGHNFHLNCLIKYFIDHKFDCHECSLQNVIN